MKPPYYTVVHCSTPEHQKLC